MQGVVAGTALRGFSFFCTTPLTILLDGGPDDGSLPASALVLRLFAGIARPSAGRVFTFGVDPAADASIRRGVALLGDPALLEDEPAETARDLAKLRGVTAELGAAIASATDGPGRRALSDLVANPRAARLVLLSFPERYLDRDAREAALGEVRAAVDRGAHAIIATRSLDDVLAFAPDDRALAVIVAGGLNAAVAPAHALPWATPYDGQRARLVRVVCEEAKRLTIDLLHDQAINDALVSIEPVSAEEVRFYTRDPRALSRAIAARAKDGFAIRALNVYGASAAELVGGMR